MKPWFAFVLAVLLTGCSKKSTKPQNGSIVTELQLTNLQGIPTTTFRVGEDQFFSYTVTNRTGKTQQFTGAAAPLTVIFFIHREDSLVGTTIDPDDIALIFPAFFNGQLLNGKSLRFKDAWQVNTEHRALPAGNYTLMVAPYIQFPDFVVFPDKTINFEVVP